MNDEILKRLANQATNLGPHPDPRFPPSPYYRFLRLLAEYLKPNLSVELGVCGAGGSYHLCLGNPNGSVVGVDIAWGEWEANVRHVLRECPNFNFWIGDSVELAKTIYERFGEVGILFVDTTHTREQTLREFNAWKPYMSKTFAMCFDDLYRKEMGNVWDELSGNKLRLDFLHPGGTEGGFGVVYQST